MYANALTVSSCGFRGAASRSVHVVDCIGLIQSILVNSVLGKRQNIPLLQSGIIMKVILLLHGMKVCACICGRVVVIHIITIWNTLEWEEDNFVFVFK